VPMGVATNQSQPYVETNYSLPSFDQYIAGTTTLGGSVAFPTGSSSSASSSGSGSSGSGSSSQGKGTSGASRSLGALSGLAVSAVFVGTLLRLLI
ncbi:hypothetical protein OG21DRAFT_1518497, partial [Imleria badia]